MDYLCISKMTPPQICVQCALKWWAVMVDKRASLPPLHPNISLVKNSLIRTLVKSRTCYSWAQKISFDCFFFGHSSLVIGTSPNFVRFVSGFINWTLTGTHTSVVAVLKERLVQILLINGRRFRMRLAIVLWSCKVDVLSDHLLIAFLHFFCFTLPKVDWRYNYE